MFTGLIKATGEISSVVQTADGGRRIEVECGEEISLRRGDSIAVDGVCLTAEETKEGGFSATLSSETVNRTTFSGNISGRRVNLEPALKTGDTLDGHFVTGHVDAAGEIISHPSADEGFRLVVGYPERLRPFLAPKGSVAVDGISLTVNEVGGGSFGVRIIPHTARETTLGDRSPGDRVNLEVDILARYVYNFWQNEEENGIEMDELNQSLGEL